MANHRPALILALLATITIGSTLNAADPPETVCGDHNNDGSVTATDALFVLQEAVGIHTTISCGTSVTTTTVEPPECLQCASVTTHTLGAPCLDCRIYDPPDCGPGPCDNEAHSCAPGPSGQCECVGPQLPCQQVGYNTGHCGGTCPPPLTCQFVSRIMTDGCAEAHARCACF